MAHYPATEGLSSTEILALVREHAAALADVIEPLPATLRVAHSLPDRPAALAGAHFPVADAEIRYLFNSRFDAEVPLALVNTKQLQFWTLEGED